MAINGRMTMGRDNLEGKFVREDCQLRLAGAGGNLVAATAAGQVLEKNWNVKRAFENWLALVFLVVVILGRGTAVVSNLWVIWQVIHIG